MRQPTQLLLAAVGLAVVTASPADEAKMTPSRYIYLETAALEISIEGMKKRLELRRADADQQSLQQVRKRTRERIEALYADWEVSPGEHATYKARNRQAVEGWLAENPDWRRDYNELERRAERMVNQLENVR